jgi:hypothetical protein
LSKGELGKTQKEEADKCFHRGDKCKESAEKGP